MTENQFDLNGMVCVNGRIKLKKGLISQAVLGSSILIRLAKGIGL